MDINYIEEIISDNIGLAPDSIGHRGIARALEERLKALNISNIDAYIALFKTDRHEIERFIEKIVVHESWFFRDDEPFEFLKNWVTDTWLPAAKKGKLPRHDRTLRVLSIACATGEEPLSIAISLLEAGLSVSQFHIDAIDISSAAIQQARLGLFRKHSFRCKRTDVQSLYFTAADDHEYKIDDCILQAVDFQQCNLFDADFARRWQPFDIIFCRNLLIYCNDSARKKALSIIDHLLLPDGLLFLGSSETTMPLPEGFTRSRHPRSFAFLRKQGCESAEKPAAKAEHCEKQKSGNNGKMKADQRRHEATENSNKTEPARDAVLISPKADTEAQQRRLRELQQRKLKSLMQKGQSPGLAEKNDRPCWKLIGVSGDQSCKELKKCIHCRNCHVYSEAGRNLLEQAAPRDYLEEWTGEIARQKAPEAMGTLSLLIFRIEQEWLALPTTIFKEVTAVKSIHTIPHRSNNIFMGLVSIRGEILLCVSLARLLGLKQVKNAVQNRPHVYSRMVVVGEGSDRWVFPVDEIQDIHRMPANAIKNAPV
ncbi:MAG: chemotaxis protein CheW, partial [Candidatus Riflebacteria bacterium]|nr:chemotaxis protein CheW [Candidatus Riflebacteria bacterium]